MRYLTKKRRAATERARLRARRRWELDRQRRDALAALAPELLINRIVRRIVVIDREQSVREAVIYEFDSAREARRKVREILKAEKLKG
jgi:hypothetical protein